MLAKLIHFEFKSTYKLFLILIGAEFLLSIVLGVSVNTNLKIMSDRLAYDPFYTSNSSTVSFILVLMVVGIVFATFMMIFGSSVQRFHKNLLSGQGYLMHTLPVTTWQLVLSKVITYMIYVILFVLAQLACLVGMIIGTGQFIDFIRSLYLNFDWLLRAVKIILDLGFIELCATYLFSASQFLLLIYLCYSVGNLFPEHRLLVGIATFIILGIVVPSLFQVPSIFVVTFGAVQVMNALNHMSYQTMTLIYSIIMNVIFFAANVYILRYHLNLE